MCFAKSTGGVGVSTGTLGPSRVDTLVRLLSLASVAGVFPSMAEVGNSGDIIKRLEIARKPYKAFNTKAAKKSSRRARRKDSYHGRLLHGV